MSAKVTAGETNDHYRLSGVLFRAF